MTMQRTLVLIKPDGVKRHLVGKILSRFEDAGLKIAGMKMFWADDRFSRKHYNDEIEKKHGKRVRDLLIEYIVDGPVVAIVLEGVEAVAVTRKLVGSTYPNEAVPGTIRGDFVHVSKNFANGKNINVKNLIHASANLEDAKNEISLWFDKEEMYNYKTLHDYLHLDEVEN